MPPKKIAKAKGTTQIVAVDTRKSKKWRLLTKEARDYTIKSMQQAMPVVLGRATSSYTRREILHQIQFITTVVKEESRQWRVISTPSRKVLLNNSETHHNISQANKTMENKLGHASSQTRALQDELQATMTRSEETESAIKEYSAKIAQLKESATEVVQPTIKAANVEWGGTENFSNEIVVDKGMAGLSDNDTANEGISTQCRELLGRLEEAFVNAAMEMRTTNGTLQPYMERLSAAKDTLTNR